MPFTATNARSLEGVPVYPRPTSGATSTGIQVLAVFATTFRAINIATESAIVSGGVGFFKSTPRTVPNSLLLFRRALMRTSAHPHNLEVGGRPRLFRGQSACVTRHTGLHLRWATAERRDCGLLIASWASRSLTPAPKLEALVAD